MDEKELSEYDCSRHAFSIFSCIMSTGSDDHGEVLDSVKSLSAQWRRLSSKLGLEISSLDRIEKDNPGDCMMCLDKALVEWLNLNYNCSKHGRPSWKRSATAVKDLDYALFERIVKEHQG